jgi:hypothetical protein
MGERTSMKLQHIVLFGFISSAGREVIEEVVRRCAALRLLVPGVQCFEWGENCSAEGLDHGHTHAFVLTFSGVETRDHYLTHPDHVAFSDWVKPLVASVTVIDYWAESKPPPLPHGY